MGTKNNNNFQLAKEWFLKAQDDELSIIDILEDKKGSPNTVCFLSQQMAEKYLKGFLVFHQKRFPKIHHLDTLINLCKKINHGFEKLRREAEELTEFYISARYPGDYPQFNFSDAQDAFRKASKIKELILRETK